MARIKVGLDISQTAHYGGVATYTHNLSLRLAKEEDLEMVFFYSSMRKPYKGKLRKVKSYRLPPTLFEMLFNRMRNIPIERFTGRLDIFHSSDWVQPPTKAKTVTTFHDMVPFKYPQWSDPKIVEVNQRRLKIVEAEVDRVIAVSEATKRDLIEVSKIPASKITVIPEGVDEQFKPQSKSEIEKFRQKYDLPTEFVLAIGGVGTRRNLKAVKQATEGYPLVITGENLPWLDFEELPLLYASAKLLLYPSFYEGFGLPVVEAMACGTPVITSDVSSLPEVGGQSVIYVDPNKVSDISKKVKQVWSDQDMRKELTKKGYQQAAKFSWERCTTETVALYKELMS